MKKFTALLIAVLLVIPAAFAFGASAEATNVALNKTYTIDTGNKEVNSTYNAKLTDGKAVEDVENAIDEDDGLNYWFGLNWKQQFDIQEDQETYIASVTIDLGETVKGLTSSRLHLGRKEDWSVFLPESVVVSISADGETFTDVGTASGSADDGASGWAQIELGGKEARYVRYTFTEINNEDETHAWIFLNEIEVYADPDSSTGEPEPQPEPKNEVNKDLGAVKGIVGVTVKSSAEAESVKISGSVDGQ
ncbi:MAG: discoidin domain-containing protein, partial [Clostridia bacterium]|nr:discoidin domain-containing protein [Clostridia bacterium]